MLSVPCSNPVKRPIMEYDKHNSIKSKLDDKIVGPSSFSSISSSPSPPQSSSSNTYQRSSSYSSTNVSAYCRSRPSLEKQQTNRPRLSQTRCYRRLLTNLSPPLIPFQFIVISACIIVFISIVFVARITEAQRQNPLCPNACSCDEQNLEILCKTTIGASGLPHTLNPNTKRMVMNSASTAQLVGIDYLTNLEYLDLAFNKISIVDFSEITKNTKLATLNTSHNNIIELKDTLVANAFTELGSTLSTLGHSNDSNELEVLRKLSKINVVDFNLSYNNLTILRNFTFIRWQKLARLDLSYNSILWLEGQALFGLNRLEIINLRGNRLVQVPTLALHSAIHSLYSTPQRPPSIIHLDLSENRLTSIGSNSFSLLEKAQKIYLESCSIESIHEQAFKGLHTLSMLSLDNNNLQEVPTKSFSYLGLLRTLKINANSLTSLAKDSFSSLENLEELQINNASFKDLQLGVFNNLYALKRLELAYNSNLTTIEVGTFASLPKLQYLNLHLDYLSTLPNDFYYNSQSSLQILDIRGNPLFCDCDLKWLTRWLKKFNETVTNAQTNAGAHAYNPQNHFDELQTLLTDSSLTNELLNLTCTGPLALSGKAVIELPENKLECLEPSSDLNVHIGFAALFFITFVLTFVCMVNFCRNKSHLLVMLKENIVQNTHISMMLPYTQNLHKNVDDLKKAQETQLYSSDYDTIDYNQTAQVHTVDGASGDQVMYYEPQPYSQHI